MRASCNSSIGITTIHRSNADKNTDKNTVFNDITIKNNYKNIMKAVKLHAIFNKNPAITVVVNITNQDLCMNTQTIKLNNNINNNINYESNIDIFIKKTKPNCYS